MSGICTKIIKWEFVGRDINKTRLSIELIIVKLDDGHMEVNFIPFSLSLYVWNFHLKKWREVVSALHSLSLPSSPPFPLNMHHISACL